MQCKVCVVGAGASGLVASKILLERGISFDCHEMGSQLGGLWRYNNDNGVSAAYQSLHINSSRREMAFSDYPMPHHFPDFPHHSQIISYFDDYARHFGVTQRIRFRSRVEHIQPTDRGYTVSIRDAQGFRREQYSHVIIANGHHWSPKHVKFPGEFLGLTMHSQQYKTPDILRGKRVLVVGIGNSGCDIACESARVSERTFLSTRRSAHIIPKYIFGKPLDRICPPQLWHYLPLSWLQRLFSMALYFARGRASRFGLPMPDHRILEEHPTVSSDLFNLLGHGKIHIKPNVEQFCGDHVKFVDGTSERIDVVVQATGFEIKFPFLDPEVLSTDNNVVRLFRHVVHPAHSGMYFVGLVQPWGPLMPLAEEQARWIASLIDGSAALPTRQCLEQEIDRDNLKMRKRYTSSPRHTIQVDYHPYLALLKRERKKGQRLAEQLRSRTLSANRCGKSVEDWGARAA